MDNHASADNNISFHPFCTSMDTAITVLVPTFRRPRTLRRALNSLLAQTFKSFRTIVLDNDNDPAVKAITEEYFGHLPITYVAHPNNIGATENFLSGLRHVNTEYFCWLNDDDIYLTNYLACAHAALAMRPSGMFFGSVYGTYNEITGDINTTNSHTINSNNSVVEFFHPTPHSLIHLLNGGYGINGTLFRSKCIPNFERYVPIINGTPSFADRCLLMNIAAEHDFLLSKQILGILISSGSNFSSLSSTNLTFHIGTAAAYIDVLTRTKFSDTEKVTLHNLLNTHVNNFLIDVYRRLLEQGDHHHCMTLSQFLSCTPHSTYPYIAAYILFTISAKHTRLFYLAHHLLPPLKYFTKYLRTKTSRTIFKIQNPQHKAELLALIDYIKSDCNASNL